MGQNQFLYIRLSGDLADFMRLGMAYTAGPLGEKELCMPAIWGAGVFKLRGEKHFMN
jgi:hypothetical protein